MIERTTKLAGASDCIAAIEVAAMLDPVRVEYNVASGAVLFFDAADRLLGRLTARHEVAKRLAIGEVVLQGMGTRWAMAEAAIGSVAHADPAGP